MVILFLIVLLFTSSPKNQASACPACWAGYGSGDERFNKPLADLRILYEKEGRGALPVIRELAKSHDDPVVKDRAISYLVELEDKAIVPMLEDIITDLTKRVSFSSFGRDSLDFQRRLRAAHALGKLVGNSRCEEDFLDKAEFEKLIAQAAALEKEARARCLVQAVALYRGDFLRGVTAPSPAFEAWTAARRERLRALALDGPFAEAKEMVGGFFLLQNVTRDEALAWAHACPAAQWATVEVRALAPCYVA